MSTRKDKVQIEVEINGQKAGVEVQKLEKKVALLDAELKKLPKGSEAAKEKMKELAAATKELDRARPTFGNLKKDAKALARELDQLEEGTEAFAKKAAQLASVNARLKAIKRSTSGVKKGMDSARLASSRFVSVLNKAGIIAIVARLASAFVSLIDKSAELSKVQRKTDAQMKATLASTGEVAGRSLEQLKAQASALQQITLFGDEETQQAQSLLLTFTKVRGEIFDQSIPAIQDYATAMATASGESVDLKAASIQVGKALNDPAKGIAALSKSGVSFSEDQKKVIKSLQDTGDIAGAQAIILKELETQFGGSAEAAAKAAGTFEQTKNKFADVLEQLGDNFNDILDFLSPFFDLLLEQASFFFGGLAKMVKAAPIVFSGLKAAVQFAMTSLSNQFNRGIIAAKIFAKELDLAVSFKDATKKRLRDELAALKEEKKNYADTGRTIGQAYAEAIGIAVKEQRESDAAKQAVKDRKLAAKQRENALAEAEEEKKRAAELAKTKAAEREKFLKQQQSRAKYAFEKENLLAEAARISVEETDLEYDARIEANKISYYKRLLGLLRSFGKEETNEFLSVQNQLSEITKQEDVQGFAPLQTLDTSVEIKSGPGDSLKQIEEDGVRETLLLQEKYANAIIAEEEHELSMLELKEASLERRIALEEFYGRTGKEQDREFKKELFDTQVELNKKRAKLREDDLKNVERTEKAKQDLQKKGVKAFGDLLGAAVGLLKEDEARRKKHASAIKAFEIARVGVNLVTEISEYWKGAAKFGPLAVGIATAQSIGAGIRAGTAVSSIQSQKFAIGGFTGKGFGAPDSTGFRPVGTVHEGEYVMPQWMVEHPVYGQIARNLEGIRTNGYATGGLATANTTPTASVAPTINNPMPGASMNMAVADKFAAAIELLTTRKLQAEVVYEDFKKTDEEAQASELNSGI